MSIDLHIVGGGISGLSLAHYAQQAGLQVQVLERKKHLGGCIQSHVFSESENQDFWIELGTHSCFNSYGNLIDILDNANILEAIQAKAKSRFLFKGDAQLTSIQNQISFLSLLLNIPKLLITKKANKTVAEYYSHIFGKKNYQRVFHHVFSGIVCQNADNLPADSLFRKKPRRKDIQRSFTFPEGLQRIPNTLGYRLNNKTACRIKTIDYSDGEFQLIDTKGKKYASTILAMATPVQHTAALLSNAFPLLAEQLAEIKHVDIETFGIMLPASAVKLDPIGGIIAADKAYYSLVSRDAVPHDRYRGFTAHFKPEGLTENDKLQIICETLNVDPEQCLATVSKANSLPSPQSQHAQQLATLEKTLAKLPVKLTGNYFAGISIEECVSRSLAVWNSMKTQEKD